MPDQRALQFTRLRAMLVPVIVYDVVLQAVRIVEGTGDLVPGAFTVADSVRFFAAPFLALCALILGCHASVNLSGRAAPIVANAIQALLALFVVLDTAAHVYFTRTGSNLDASAIAYWGTKLRDVQLIASGEVNVAQWISMAIVIFGIVILPRIAERRASEFSQPISHGRAPLQMAVFVLLLMVAYRMRSPLAVDSGIILNGIESAMREGPDLSRAHLRGFESWMPRRLRLERSGDGPQRNVVIVILESTRADAMTIWNPSLHTTPFLDRLAKTSLVAERFHAIIPNTSKALTAILCGLPPAHTLAPLDLRGCLASRCLPRLLRKQGYDSAFFQSAARSFDEREGAIQRMGYETFSTGDDYGPRGYQEANFLGREDESLLDPMLDWVRGRKGKPFLLTVLTVNAHHRVYPLTRYGTQAFSGNDSLNSYLNAVWYDDMFVEKLVAGLERIGVFKDTLLVVVGDHGDAFGEHGLWIHNRVPYEEVLRIPLIIHDPRGENPEPAVIHEPGDQLDLLPTVVDLLGLHPVQGSFQGQSLLHLSPNRALLSSCYGLQACLARLQGSEKYIHHFGRRPDELFDLASDPEERHDLAATQNARAVALRFEVLGWDRAVKALYFFGEHDRRHREPAAEAGSSAPIARAEATDGEGFTSWP